jgi:hypothetical protein
MDQQHDALRPFGCTVRGGIAIRGTGDADCLDRGESDTTGCRRRSYSGQQRTAGCYHATGCGHCHCGAGDAGTELPKVARLVMAHRLLDS